MRAQWIRGVFAGLIVGALPAVALAQAVQIIPVSPATSAPIPIKPVTITPAQPTVGMPAPGVMPAQPAAPQPLAPMASTMGTANSSAARRLEISFANGAVTLVAHNVTLREILAEWQRVGGSHIVDGDKLRGAPMSYEFSNQPEQKVLESLLRSAAGYVLAPQVAVAGKSSFAQILILPTSTASSSTFVPQQPQYGNQPGANGMPDEELAPAIPGFINGPVPRPVPSQPQPQPQNTPQAPQTMPSAGQTSPMGGVIIAPLQPANTPQPAATKPNGGRGGGPGR